MQAVLRQKGGRGKWCPPTLSNLTWRNGDTRGGKKEKKKKVEWERFISISPLRRLEKGVERRGEEMP